MKELEQLERDGYMLVPDFLDRDTTARIRAHMDSLLPPVAPRSGKAQRLHDLRHPIPGAIMAEILDNPRLLELAKQTLHADDLRLVEQVLIRTDPNDAPPGAYDWHIDMGFLPQHFEARPRGTYFHMVHALNTVPEGGGATMIVPGSHRKNYAQTQNMGLENMAEFKVMSRKLTADNFDGAIEVCANEGDLLVFNPMCFHSPSTNVSDHPRYVYFVSFMDASATYLRDHLEQVGYNKGFPDSLRDNLRAESQSLLT